MASSAGTLYVNGRIFTRTAAGIDDEPTFAEAMLVQDGTITAVGTQSELTSKSPSAETVDLDQQTVLPGFIDGHMHLLRLGQSLQRVSLAQCKSLEEIRKTIKDFAVANPDAPRVLAKDLMWSMTPNGVTAADLDDLDERCIFVDTKDLHSTWANSKGLEALGVMDMKEDPAGGHIQRDASGRPNGVLSEGAVLSIVWPTIAMMSTTAELQESMIAAMDNYHSEGYTGFIDMAMDSPAWDALVDLAGKQKLSHRIAAYWIIKPTADPEERLAQVLMAKELSEKFNKDTSPNLRCVGIKIVCDGIVDACTAFLGAPYHQSVDSDKPCPAPPPFWSAEDLAPVVKKADELGMQIALHAIGDHAIKMAVDSLEKYGTPGRRHRIEHLEMASPEDAARLGKLGLTASIQPVHADPAILRAWPRLLGEDRCGRAFAYREMADSGALMALGSDSPTAPWAPLKNIYVAATRKSAREVEYEKAVNEHFRLGVCEGIVAATRGAAASVWEEDRVGSIEVGKKADFVVCEMDWTKVGLLAAKVKETWFEGEKVWQSETENQGWGAFGRGG